MANDILIKLDTMNVNGFQKDLIGWFTVEQRQLPWREDQDPYKVWVSEIMLQQTRVDTVIPYFNHFTDKFPTIDSLASAEEEEVLKAWEGLGYYSRVRNLHSAVKDVVENYGGKVPETLPEISKLKGVGPYTAGAILSIAFAKPEPAVDGNVMRVLSRILLIKEDIAKPATRKIFEEAVREMISHENPSFFNQALMELGALICTPTSPSCLLCPVREHCSAFHEGVQRELPVKVTKKTQRHVTLAAAIITDKEGNLLIQKRPNKGLLANLWQFPNVEAPLTFQSEKEQLSSYLNEKLKAEITITGAIGQIEHVFSHLTWSLRIYKGSMAGEISETVHLKKVSLDEVGKYAFPVPFQKALKLFAESHDAP